VTTGCRRERHGVGIIASDPFRLTEPRLEPRTIRFAYDDQIVGVAGETIDGLCARTVGRRGQPFFCPVVRGDDDRAGAIALKQQVVEIATFDGIEDVYRKSRRGSRGRRSQFPELRFVAVIEPRVLEHFEHVIVAHGDDAGAAPAGDVAECMREKRLADVHRPDNRDVGVRVEEAERRELIEQRAVEGDLRGVVQASRRRVGSKRAFCTKRDGEAVAPRDFVAEDLQQDPEAAASADGPA
jgi:hypothetical protein